MSAHGQTISFLQRRLAEAGVFVKHRHGQNFLIDLNLLNMLVAAIDLQPQDVILEVGTGMGGLTMLMAPQAAAIVSAEIDPQMHQLASEELIDFPNVTLLRLDALASKNRLSPELLAAVDERLAAIPGAQFKLAANLPYNVATPLISNLLDLDRPPVSMTVTIQKEVAERLIAEPGSKDYGALSIWVQSQCAAQIVRIMQPSVFWPAPKVESAIVHIELEPDRRARIPDRRFFHDFIRAMFMHRRKFLRSVLISAVKDRLDKAEVDQILAALALDPGSRAEQLAPADMLRLCEGVRTFAQ
ncbi:MAG TPA: 16S rRNA (adenine(1518)-N(6)/adenine(1519)-N(6))-dimethyltransferase RsmA [Pirellulales bacterium]|jgi:16S rRNA (adenine1518-N6/adenine1519-N6)-dimethyltransferase|nr:16S rRNA (adenine(1518)-N(6)/adenine(1519)-N(6))-dimethyltransferase RsmA [Pirellulales bacterium]